MRSTNQSSAPTCGGGGNNDDQYLLTDNCYAEVHVPVRWGLHEATSATVTCVEKATNTDLQLTVDERAVLHRLDEVQATWAVSAGARERSEDGADAVPRTPTTAVVVAADDDTAPPPFTPELCVTTLLDALWAVRYRPGVVKQLDVRRQRAALVAAKKARRKEAAALATSGEFVLSPTIAKHPPPPPEGVTDNNSEGSTSMVSRAAAVSPGQRALLAVQPLSPSIAAAAAAASSSTGFLAAAGGGGALSPFSNQSFSDSTSFDGMSFGSSMGFWASAAGQQSAEERVPRVYPLASLRTELRAYTNVSIRALVPVAAETAADYNPNAIRPEASNASYAGRDHTCRCLLDLIPLCPNVQHVSIAGHRCVTATVEALVRCIGSQHPSLASVDLRGNVIEVPVAKALARAVRSNPRITSVLVDKGCMLLPSTERNLLQLVDENAQKMRTVSKMRSAWTQTTLLPQPLPQDIAEYCFARQAAEGDGEKQIDRLDI